MPSSSPVVSGPGSNSPGPQAPTGATGVTGPEEPTGVIPAWVFDTTTRKWVTADKASFTYDKASGYWLSPKYHYDKRTGWYKIIPPSATPQPAYMLTTAPVVHTVLGDIVVGSPDYQLAKMMGIIGADGQPTNNAAVGMTGTGPGSTNIAGISNTNQNWFDLTNLVNVVTAIQSAASSGNVNATSNTSAGNAASGTASVLANVINLLASAWSWANGDLSFFTQNIGNHTGDITLQPTASTGTGGGQLGVTASTNGTGPGSTNQTGIDNTNTLDVNAKSSGSITNNIDVAAQSGNATAQANTSAGNVTTGNALAQVNIVNLINSFISSGSSFFGVLNIMGNLNGDILFPTGFLDSLLPSGTSGGAGVTNNLTGPDSTNQTGISNTNNANINNTANTGITNNINNTAASGSATVDKNTQAGNASTGAATTANSLFNLANSSIFGDNAVLVIVNVMGRWVGRIMSLPGGQTESALLTGGAQVSNNATGPDSSNQANIANSNNANINNEANGTITNNVNVHAQSGDATATSNTKTGDVSTGEAKAATSMANIVNSALNVKHWFGVLVINVFGEWTGAVNEDTAAGNASQGPNTQQSGVSNDASLVTRVTEALTGGQAGPGVTGGGQGTRGTTATSHAGTQAIADVATVGGAAGSVLSAVNAAAPLAATAVASHGKDMSLIFLISAILMLLAGALLSAESRLKRLKQPRL